MEQYSTNDLYHHGIHGQRWGVRRFQNEDGSLTEAGKARYDTDYDAASQSSGSKQRKAIKSLSNDDLADRIRRLEQEKRYKQLLDEVNHPARKKAAEFVETAFARPAADLAGQVTKAALGLAINYGAKKLGGAIGGKRIQKSILRDPNKREPWGYDFGETIVKGIKVNPYKGQKDK